MNLRKLDEIKVLRDPVHEYVRVEYDVFWKLIDTPEFQRLKRIHQLGGTSQVYHGAEHSRFSHSLGVYEITRRMINEIDGLSGLLSDYEKVVVLCAALLHDVGHGPFSHAFETVTGVYHEKMTLRIIREETTITQILRDVHEDLVEDVCAVIDHQHPQSILTQMISSQLDADRMDYLLRDSYFTGVSYGAYDLERILRTFKIKDDQLVIKQSGVNAVEDYIMARYQMYWQVYYHPVSRAYELMLLNIFKRIKDVYPNNPRLIERTALFLIPFIMVQEISVQDYLFLDESTMQHGFKMLSLQAEDPILSDLANRLLNRDIFKYINYDSDETVEKIKEKVKKAGVDPKYYVGVDSLTQQPYLPYVTKGQQIMILMDDGSVQELSKVSDIVNAIVHGQSRRDSKLFFPKLEVRK